MSIYAITIQPVDSDGKPSASARAQVRVDTGGGQPRIIEMSLQSSAPSGLTTASLPIIDLASVVEALQAGIAITTPADQEIPERQQARSSHPEGDVASVRQRGAAASDAQQSSGVESGRAYRRMPDTTELKATYDRIGTITGVAKHYGVPRHTAQGWVARLRKIAEKA